MAGKIDPIAGMFSARVTLKDESSKPLESISENIDRAVEGSSKLQDEFGGLQDNVEKLNNKTQDVLKDTKNMGILGAALMGIRGKGSLVGQIKGAKDEMGGFGKFLAGAVTTSILGVGSALLSVVSIGFMVKDILSLAFIPAALPGLVLNALGSVQELLGPFEAMRQTIKMTNDEVATLGDNVIETMGSFGFGADEVLEVYTRLGELGKINNEGLQEMATNTLVLQHAFKGLGLDIVGLQRQLADGLGMGQDAVMGIANAMQHVASTTSLTHTEVQDMITTISDGLIWKLPAGIRNQAMPNILADIATIGGAFKDVMGNPQTLIRGFDQALDVFNEGGHRLKASIVGWGGATATALEDALNDGNAGEFLLAEIRAVKNLKENWGDVAFTRNAEFLAEQFGKSREELIKISRIDLDKMDEKIAISRATTENTKEIMKAWGRADGLFNDIWTKVSNIGEAFLKGMGKPFLDIMVPVLDVFDNLLTSVLGLLQGQSVLAGELTGLAAIFGSIVYIVGTFAGLLAAVGAIATAPAWGTIAAVVAGIAVAGWAAYEAFEAFGDPIMEIAGIMWDRIWPIIKNIGKAFLLLTPGVNIITALIVEWETFVKEVEPAMNELAVAWDNISLAINDVFREWKKALGETSDGVDLFKEFGGVMKFVVKGIAGGIKLISSAIYGISLILRPMIAFIGKLVEPIFKLFGMLTDAKARLFDGASNGKGFWSNALEMSNELHGIPAGIESAKFGGVTQTDGPVNLHANEAIVPLDRMPEFIGGAVNIHQDDVVDEIKKLRETIEMLSRRGGSSLQALGA